MGRYFILCIFFISLSAKGQYYLDHINVINVENGNVAKNKSIFIKDSRIAGIFPGTIKHSGVQSYDCTGKYIMPGLWDMHIHDAGDSSTRFEYIPLFLANGVTGVRDMWGSEDMLKLKKDINSGKFIGPRMIVGSPIIDGKIPFFIEALPAATEEQGRHYVDSLTDAGYDFIKIYSLVRKSVYLAIADECKKRGIPLMGHLPIEIGLQQAIQAGQRSFEHNFNVNRYLTGKETELLRWSHYYLDTLQIHLDPKHIIHNEPLGISERNFYIAPSVLKMMIAKRVAIVPTLTITQGYGLDGELMARRTKGLEYLTSEFVNYWIHHQIRLPAEYNYTFGAAAKFLVNKGVLILAGTDVNNPFCVPGFGLQQELINLHNAGLTNLQVLETATINPAKFLYKEKELGTVSIGKIADLLILDKNPLLQISNTQKINAVIVNGKYISNDDIQRMLDAQRKR